MKIKEKKKQKKEKEKVRIITLCIGEILNSDAT